MERAVAEANNGVAGVGVCPDCMVLPIKAGQEALDTTDRIAQSVLFATDSGASVITLLTAELGYSDFTKQALQYAWDKGVVVVGASNDFDSADHQEGMFWPHEWPGNGLQPNDLEQQRLRPQPPRDQLPRALQRDELRAARAVLGAQRRRLDVGVQPDAGRGGACSSGSEGRQAVASV